MFHENAWGRGRGARGNKRGGGGFCRGPHRRAPVDLRPPNFHHTLTLFTSRNQRFTYYYYTFLRLFSFSDSSSRRLCFCFVSFLCPSPSVLVLRVSSICGGSRDSFPRTRFPLHYLLFSFLFSGVRENRVSWDSRYGINAK